FVCVFFFNDTATTEIYTLSLHDALPIFDRPAQVFIPAVSPPFRRLPGRHQDRKSTRLNSSHDQISYAVFCLKKKPSRRRKDKHVFYLNKRAQPAMCLCRKSFFFF